MLFEQDEKSVPIYLLLMAMLNLWTDAGIIFAVVDLNALLGLIQEGKTEKALDSIRNMLSAIPGRCAAVKSGGAALNNGHSNGLCVAHGAHMAVALVSNRREGPV